MEGKLILTAKPLRIKNFLLDHFLRSSWDLDCNWIHPHLLPGKQTVPGSQKKQ